MRSIVDAPKTRRIILYAPSGYIHMPFRCDVGCWTTDPERPHAGYWLDSSYTRWTDGGAEPVAWSELPEGWESFFGDEANEAN